ncbi:hypothetical protein F511_06944 [Dorcoceras hygrometricum]|uniref:Secreted protein n=1 Tax=Dorcoceras hygrometricum TaxID=472368 RepID=A0A2Z7D2U1_9LAMI|nr:hypothetical protein F511_06944 [Dorcoceras hygrometricum]
MFFLYDVVLSLALLDKTADSFCSTADHWLPAESSSSRHADVIVAVSRFLPISNADVIVAARSFFQ